MPVDTKHPEYVHREPDWISCRDAFNGQRAVKKAGTRYLPRLTGQSDDEYAAYKERALFYSITDKTVSALVGLALSKPPVIELPEKMMKALRDDNGLQFDELFHESVQEILLQGRIGILVDRPTVNGPLRNLVFHAEDILNWQTDDYGELTRVVLREYFYDTEAQDVYAYLKKERYYDLYIDETGYYRADIYERPSATADVLGPPKLSLTPVNRGQRMDYIPFYVANPIGLGLYDHKPPMLDIVHINISHYRSSADLEHGRHFTGLPTPWVTGAESATPLHVGSTSAWIIPNEKARVGFLEFTGQGLQSLEKALSEKQSQLASLSARLIDGQSRGSEAAETVKLRYTSETASLRTIVRSTEALLNTVYRTHANMEGLAEEEVKIQLNRDFLDERLSGRALEALVESYLKGGISKETLIYNLRRGDILPPHGTEPGDLPPRVNPNERQGLNTSEEQ